ncbi:MAG: hypothetical protein KKF41_10485 [Actinobacteria bacterium]|nr:hypothetical protein [Actinomycetota bacterium]MBU1943053.1 hypothetical protein [Actinomycetota bacterium]MBU2688000.1 hypothetical protein [Actinomycetota bacterium]
MVFAFENAQAANLSRTAISAFRNNAIEFFYRFVPAWFVFILLSLAILFVLLSWSRIRWRYRYASRTITYRVYFAHHSEDLPLRSEQLGNVLHDLKLPLPIRLITGQPHLTVTFKSCEDKSLLVSVPDVRHFTTLVKTALLDKLRGCSLEIVDFSIPQRTTRRRFVRMSLVRKSSAYSLRTLKGFETDDPLEVLLNSMDFGPNATSYVQILLRPSAGSWKRGARRLREKIRTEDNADLGKAIGRGGLVHLIWRMLSVVINTLVEGLNLLLFSQSSFSPNGTHDNCRDHRRELSEETKEIVKSIDDKLNCQSSFAFEIRVIVEKQDARHYDVNRLTASFRQYDKHQGLIGRHIYWPASRLVDYLVRNSFWPLYKCAGFLSSDELAGFLHNPYKNTVLVKVDTNNSRSAPAALQFTKTEGARVCLGTNDHRGESDRVSIPWHDFYHHTLVVGTTGSGKSTLLKSMVLQWIDSGSTERPRGAMFIEPHGDACQELLSSIPEKHLNRVYYMDPSFTDSPLAFNPLAYSEIYGPERTKDAIIAAFHAIWELDPSMANLMLYLPRVTDILSRVPEAHFGWIRPFITDKDFRERVLADLDDPEATKFWAHYSSKKPAQREDETRSLLNRVDQFILDRRLRYVFCQPQAKIDFTRIIDEGKILICHFGDRNAGPIGKRLLGNLFCSYIHQAAQSRSEERRPFFVCMDECSEYLTPTIASILAQDRKFNIVFLAAFQYLAQTEDLLAGLKGNTNTRICFNVGEEDALALAPLFASSSDPEELRRRADDLMNLERYQCFLKSTVQGKPLPPTTFNLEKPLTLMHPENADTVLRSTRDALCRSLDDVINEQAEFLDNANENTAGRADCSLFQPSKRRA